MNNVFGLISNYCNYGIQKDNAINYIFDRLLTSSFKIRVIVNQLHIKLLSVYYFGSKYISSCPLELYSFIVIFTQPINKLNYQRFCSSSVKNGSSFLNLHRAENRPARHSSLLPKSIVHRSCFSGECISFSWVRVYRRLLENLWAVSNDRVRGISRKKISRYRFYMWFYDPRCSRDKSTVNTFALLWNAFRIAWGEIRIGLMCSSIGIANCMEEYLGIDRNFNVPDISQHYSVHKTWN